MNRKFLLCLVLFCCNLLHCLNYLTFFFFFNLYGF
uniref:Uncharacterized protein n=1 Tax=Rhizophora mucronata TaxID=61149 RepID=A0A2P2R341_RHIMU